MGLVPGDARSCLIFFLETGRFVMDTEGYNKYLEFKEQADAISKTG
jgi:hypothetical protein